MITLVCLPFAGAGASFFHPWQAIVGDAVRVLPLQLPGRERLIDAEPHRDVHRATDDLLVQLRERLDDDHSRIVLFGHSLGAVLAYELAHRLVREPGVELVRLFASGSPEPGSGRERRATELSDDEFLARVSEFAGYTHEALDDPEMREMILPTLRADVEMHENYRPQSAGPIDVPVTAIRGEHDELVSGEQAAQWAAVTTAPFTLAELPGGHMYLTESPDAVLSLVAATVGDR
jgi:surfactin synthase thioesterase subunit